MFFIDEDEIVIKAKYQKMYTEKYKQDMDFVIIGDRYIGPFIDMDVAQKAVSAINNQFAQQPRTRTEYEKVTESIFDLRDEFERGELYFRWFGNSAKGSGGVGYDKITTENMLLCRYEEGRLLRKVEKEIDWRDEVNKDFPAINFRDLDSHNCHDLGYWNPDEFLELCRVALRASGEIE